MVGPAGARPGRADAWGRALVWAGTSLVAYVFTGVVALLAVALVEQPALPAIGVGAVAEPWDHGLVLGAAPLLWGLLLAAAVPRLGRAIVGPLRPAAALTWALVGCGLIVAAGLQVALYGWALERFGSYDIEAMGASNLLPAALVATSLAFLAARMARAEARTIARIALGISLTVAGAILLLNVPGVHDGIRPQSLLLAVAMVAATAFVICVGLVAFAVPRPDRLV